MAVLFARIIRGLEGLTKYQRLSTAHSAAAFEKLSDEEPSIETNTNDSDDPLLNGYGFDPSTRYWTQPIKLTICHTILVATYSMVFLVAWKYQSRTHCTLRDPDIVRSPARDAVQYIPTVFGAALRIESPFVGPPSPEVDKAWSELLYYTNIRVSGADLQDSNMSSIEVPGEEDSYWAALSVMHELHCVKRLRQYIYEDYYFPNITEEEKRVNSLHNDHCLEIIRQGVMCRGDIALVPMHWTPTTAKPVADFGATHQCVDWNALMEWSKPRFLDILRPNYLKHPTLGYSYPDGKNHGIGVADDPEYVLKQNAESEVLQHEARSKLYSVIEKIG